MDNFEARSFGDNDDFDEPIPLDDDLDKPIPLDDDLDKPIPLDDDTGEASVSHSPLNLGGGETGGALKSAAQKMAEEKPVGKTASAADRITGVKTFFTKLHPGAMEFLDGQIKTWLRENPDIKIRRTDTTTGDVQAKKTEPNIIITVWY
jgi:hypothetical protein